MHEICKKYENLKNVDKISVANENLEEVSDFMIKLRSSIQDSTRKMLDNQVQL